jgi:hypothetical protein
MSSNSPYLDRLPQNNPALPMEVHTIKESSKILEPMTVQNATLTDQKFMDVQDYIYHEKTTIVLGGTAIVFLMISAFLIARK